METARGVAFTMPFIEGEDLREVVKKSGPLPVHLACDYIRQTALGLQHAHERGFIHRDIKPGNLILDQRGQVKILDFGLAKAVREHESPADLTQPNRTLGTPAFLAPEQWRDARKADIRADVYSLGCTLYYLLTGNPPFRAPTIAELEKAHRSAQARALDKLRADVPPELADLVAKMMAKRPGRRYQSPAEVVNALAPFAEPGKIGLSPDPRLDGGARVRWLRLDFSEPRSRLLAALAGCLVLVVILAASRLYHPIAQPPTVAYPCECDVHVTERGGEQLAPATRAGRSLRLPPERRPGLPRRQAAGPEDRLLLRGTDRQPGTGERALPGGLGSRSSSADASLCERTCASPRLVICPWIRRRPRGWRR